MPLFSSSKKEKDAPSTPKSAKATPMVDEPESTKASRVLDSVMDDDDVPMTEESMAAEAKEAYIEQYSPPSTADNEPVEVVDAADAVERFLNGEVDQAIAAKAEAARRRSEVEAEEPYLGDAPAPEAPAPAPAPPPVMLPEEAPEQALSLIHI